MFIQLVILFYFVLSFLESLSFFPRYGPGRQSRQQSLDRLNQLQSTIVGWEGKDIVANSSEIVYEGKLKVGTEKKKLRTRD